MIEILGLIVVLLVQVLIMMFGYYSAVGQVNQILDIEEPDSPQIAQNLRTELFSGKALTVEDIDEIEDWDEFDASEETDHDDSRR